MQDSTGFSPNELVFGHTVQGPFRIVAQSARSLVRETKFWRSCLLWAQTKYTSPYTVIEKISDVNYLIVTPGRKKSRQLCHVNLLKSYYIRGIELSHAVDDGVRPAPVRPALVASLLAVTHVDGVPEPDDSLLYGRLSLSVTWTSCWLICLSPNVVSCLNWCGNIPVCLATSLRALIGWSTTLMSGAHRPLNGVFITSPETLKHFDSEVAYMLENNIAVPLFSSWASPCILVPKQDKTPRFCTDMRKVNSVTKPDSFPLPQMEDCIDQVVSTKFVRKFDLLKGYWQVPLSKRAQEIAAFITPSGLYSYTVMLFGLRNAPATFQRLMN